MLKYQTVVHALKSHAMDYPERMAVWAENEGLNYKELYQLACGFSKYLISIGLHRGDCVLMHTEQSLWYVVALYGTHMAGGIFAPLEKDASKESISDYISLTGASIIISKEDCESAFWVDVRRLREVAMSNLHGSDEFMLPDPEEPAELLFTAGSTGRPKGVLLSHKNVRAVAENLKTGMEYRDDTLLVVPGALNHSNAVRKIHTTILNGSGVAILDGMMDVGKFFSLLDEMPVTALCFHPSVVHALLTLCGDEIGKYADSIEFIENGTAPLPEIEKERLRELLPHTRLYNSYGLTEAGSSCMYDYNQMRGMGNCIGREMINSHFIVVDDERREIESSKDNCGLLAVGGDVVMMRYWDEPELTADCIDGGYFFTSDVGYINEGLIYLTGRKDDMLNIGGRMVSPVEIEEVAMDCPAVADCACVPVEDALQGQAPKLFVVVKEGAELDKRELFGILRNKLEASRVPKKVEVIDFIPRSFVGKKLRKELIIKKH